ncbi:MAG TPA: hypothetical protein VIG33_14920 [Pseudobdellovibrionaceae bacterium]|jgi:hypothetical protein
MTKLQTEVLKFHTDFEARYAELEAAYKDKSYDQTSSLAAGIVGFTKARADWLKREVEIDIAFSEKE